MNIVSTLKNIAKGSSKTAATVAFRLKKAAPKIAVFGGAIGTIGAGVWAVKKTATDAPEVLDEIKSEIEKVKKEGGGKAAVTKVYVKGCLKMFQVYSGPVIVEIGSVCAIFYGYNLIDGRLVAMSATAAALEEANRRTEASVKNYRNALRERYGNEFDKDLDYLDDMFAVAGGKAEKSVPVDENGEEGYWEANRTIDGPCDTISPYAVIFDETSTEWSSDPEYNKLALRRIQQTCNDRLHANGHLFLNDVYRELGLPDTRMGQMVGWIDGGDGDNYVDFGIYDINAVNNRREFINGYEPSIILDFNVDGLIWDKI